MIPTKREFQIIVDCWYYIGVDGEVLTICDGLIDYGRNEIEVEWLNEKSQATHTSRHCILDLKCEAIAISFYYPDHLPILGKGNNHYSLNNLLHVAYLQK